MGKFLTRLSIITISIYFLITYLIAQSVGINLFENFYILLLELTIVVYSFGEGKYHCKYIKYLALCVFISDTITRLDYKFNFLSVSVHNLIPIGLIAIGMCTSLILSLRHYFKVRKLKLKRYATKYNTN